MGHGVYINKYIYILYIYIISCCGVFSVKLYVKVHVLYRVGQKTGLFLRLDNYTTTNDRKACKVSEFCLE